MRNIFVGVGIILVIVFGYLLYVYKPVLNEGQGGLATVEETYTNDKYAISFDYPKGYVLSEAERGNAERGHYAISLVREEDSGPRVDTEGPTAITVDIYQNNLNKQSLVSWLTDTNDSNYKLSNNLYASTTVGGVEATSYKWSGLYEGETVIFLHHENVIAISVTSITAEDPNIGVYRSLLESFRLLPAKTLSEEDAISYLQNMFPELKKYPSDNLPPRRIESEKTASGWNVGFIMYGSGRPGVLGGVCYSISHAKEVTKIGEYSAGVKENISSLSLSTCKPK